MYTNISNNSNNNNNNNINIYSLGIVVIIIIYALTCNNVFPLYSLFPSSTSAQIKIFAFELCCVYCLQNIVVGFFSFFLFFYLIMFLLHLLLLHFAKHNTIRTWYAFISLVGEILLFLVWSIKWWWWHPIWVHHTCGQPQPHYVRISLCT